MKNKEAIEELQSLKVHCSNMMEGGSDDPWKRDVEALEMAIVALKRSDGADMKGGE